MSRPAKAIFATATLTIAALSLAPSVAHVLEAPPRLGQWPAELWRETTVFNGQYLFFERVGAPMDVAAIIAPGVLAALLRREPLPLRAALIGTALYAIALGAWAGLVAPANTILATWRQGAVPENFEAVRNRWEIGHMVVASMKLAGFAALALAVSAAGSRHSRGSTSG